MIDYTNLFDSEGLILFLDFKKAFDTVEWPFMFSTLKKFGFKDSFIKWTKIIYTNITSIIVNNGWMSDPFPISRGIRQGCPLSALLFVIVAEILATKIRTSNQIEGIQIISNNEEKAIKISQLADDTTLFLKNENEIKSALSIINDFGKHSGLKLNINKTEGMWLGRFKNRQFNIENINFTKTTIECLGVIFGHSRDDCIKLNWIKKKSMISKN